MFGITPEPLLYRHDYYYITGSYPAAIIMSQVHYWHSPSKNHTTRLRVYKKGEWWVAKTLNQWGHECGLTYEAVKQGLNLLAKLGLIIKGYFMFGGLKTLHVRHALAKKNIPLTKMPDLSGFPQKMVPEIDKPVVKSGLKKATKNQALTDSECAFWSSPVSVKTPESITESTPETTKKEKEALPQEGNALLPAGKGGKKEETGEEGKIQKHIDTCQVATVPESLNHEDAHAHELPMTKPALSAHGKKMESSSDILKQIQAAKAAQAGVEKAPAPEKYNVFSFTKDWRSLLAEHHPELGCVVPFTIKQKAQIKALIKLWGVSETRGILTYVLTDWGAYTAFCKLNSGAFKMPLRPTLSFLLRYKGEGKNFWLEKTKPKILPKTTNIQSAIMPAVKEAVSVSSAVNCTKDPLPSKPLQDELDELGDWMEEQSFNE